MRVKRENMSQEELVIGDDDGQDKERAKKRVFKLDGGHTKSLVRGLFSVDITTLSPEKVKNLIKFSPWLSVTPVGTNVGSGAQDQYEYESEIDIAGAIRILEAESTIGQVILNYVWHKLRQAPSVINMAIYRLNQQGVVDDTLVARVNSLAVSFSEVLENLAFLLSICPTLKKCRQKYHDEIAEIVDILDKLEEQILIFLKLLGTKEMVVTDDILNFKQILQSVALIKEQLLFGNNAAP